jgi:hypothetical protein
LFLLPEVDVAHQVVVIDLILQRIGSRSKDTNLLEPPGHWHGYQPFSFVASDFAPGAVRSPNPDLRVIDVRKLRIQLQIKVIGVDVQPTSAGSSTKLPYRFDILTLQIGTRRLLEDRSTTLK